MDEIVSEIDIRSAFGVLRRQFRLIVACLIATLGLSGIWLFSLTPTYNATALVLVDTSTKNLLSREVARLSSGADSARLDSEVEILRADSMLLQVIRSQDLIRDSEFGVSLELRDKVLTWFQMSDGELATGEAAVQQVLSKLRSAVSVRRRGLTYLISVGITSTDPKKAADLANTLASTYVQDQLANKVNSVLASRDILERRITEASASIANSESSLDEYIFANLDRITTETGRADLMGLRLQLTGVETRHSQSEALASLVNNYVVGQSWASLAEDLQSTAIAELERQRQTILTDIAAGQSVTEQNVDLEAELARIEEELVQSAAEAQTQLQQEVSNSQSLIVDLRNQIRTTAISSDLPTEMLGDVYALQQNATIARAQYQTLLSRLREVETQADLQLADSRIVSPALAPRTPAFPNSRLILALASMLGLGLGVGLAFLNEYYFGGFSSVHQVEAVLHRPVVAVVPKLKQRDPEQTDAEFTPADALVSSPLSGYSEAIRRIRAGIELLARPTIDAMTQNKKRSGIVVMVCSALPNEGKSTMALSLARACVLSGQKTLLIDADLRKPSVHKQIGLEPSSGLFNFLTGPGGAKSLAQILNRDNKTDLDLILGQGRSSVPTDQLVSNERFARLVKSSKTHFDVVVIDTPPIGPVVDAFYLARYVDVLLVVIRWADTSQTDVKTAIKRLNPALSDNAQIGIILNQQTGDLGDKYYKYADYYDEG